MTMQMTYPTMNLMFGGEPADVLIWGAVGIALLSVDTHVLACSQFWHVHAVHVERVCLHTMHNRTCAAHNQAYWATSICLIALSVLFEHWLRQVWAGLS
jgi:hypothetical protein